MEQFAFHRALEAIWEFIGAVNRYIDTTQPWALAKDPAKASVLNRVLVTLADSLRFLGVILAPFLPDAAAKIRRAIGDGREPSLANAAMGRINTIPRVERLSGLFPRVDDKARPLVGKKVVIVANLEAAKLMGIESQGMVLAGSAGDRLAVVTPDRDLPPGARVK